MPPLWPEPSRFNVEVPIREISWPNGGWTRADLERQAAEPGKLYRQVYPEEIADLRAALAHLKSKHPSPVNLFSVLPEDFPLDAFLPVLEAIRDELQEGNGIINLRGFPVAEHSTEDLELIFWGIGLYLGVARPQGKESLFLTNVRDVGVDYRGSSGRGYTSRSALDFHSDGSDVAGLFCLKVAISGGESIASSSIRAHNVMLAERPDLLQELYQPMTFGRQGEEAPEEPPHYLAPIMGRSPDGSWACRHIRNHIRTAQISFPDVPRLTPKQLEALDYFDAILAREDMCYRSHMLPGDMMFMNNHIVLHSRTGYEDHAEFERKRHLLRLWLACPDAPMLPDAWKPAYKDVETPALRGGFRGQKITPAIREWEKNMAERHGMQFRIYEGDNAPKARL
ncbi:taurine catabolism dioxygenase, TauD/TfdA family [Hyaloraphidium curvatum]|nr:taurine catabolism dioxygenase, TauD/TfdA family [Hyaloraphidium curvatum]